jgi:hypothetical protein
VLAPITAKRRWLEEPKNLKDGVQYRPGALKDVAALLDALDPTNYGLGPQAKELQNFDVYEVQRGDNLSKIAKAMYGRGGDYNRIFRANLHQIDDRMCLSPYSSKTARRRPLARDCSPRCRSRVCQFRHGSARPVGIYAARYMVHEPYNVHDLYPRFYCKGSVWLI